MSVLDRNSVDLVYCDGDKVFLGVSDHLSWSNDVAQDHWTILQDKLKDYFGFISSGQCKENYPDKTPCVIIYFSYQWSDVVEKYLNKLKAIYYDYNIDFDWVYDPQDETEDD